MFQNGKPPIRIEQYIPSFPHLRLSAAQQLIRDLELQDTARFEFWKGEWVIIDLNSILSIEKGQRVLLKICPSLRMTLEDCPGIEEELDLQPKHRSNGVKRLGESLVSPIRKAARTTASKSVSESKPNLGHGLHCHSSPPTLFSSLSDESSQETCHDQQIPPPPQLLRKLVPDNKQLPVAKLKTKPQQLERTNKPTALISHPLNKANDQNLKRWPFDFNVYQIHNGLIQIRDTLKKCEVKSTSHRHLSRRGGKEKLRPKYTIKVEEAFYAAFPGTKFRKATFYEHRELWAQYDRKIIDMFIDLEDSEVATYEHLLKALKDPSRIPSPRPQYSSSSSSESESESDSDSGRNFTPGSQADLNHEGQSSNTNEFSTLQSAAAPEPLNSRLESLRTRVREYTEILEVIFLDPTESQFFQSSKNTNYQAGSSLSQLLPSGALADCIA